MTTIAVFGATSGIADACQRTWAQRGARFVLVARDDTKLQVVADDLRGRGASAVETIVQDLDDADAHARLVDDVVQRSGAPLDIVLVAHGTLPDQRRAEQDAEYAAAQFATNGANIIHLLTHVANALEQQRGGTLAVITSVAGDRGRASNYLYGAAKAAVTTFCDGLRGRLRSVGAHVVVIKPGFVRTPMTAHLQLPGPLTSTPQRVATSIVAGIDRNQHTVYAPGFWWAIMFVIRHLPSSAVARMKA